MPHVAQRILVVANNERTTTQQLAECVALDPAVTTQLLRWANSSMYGTRIVRDLVGAIVTLGFEQAAELALAASIRDLEGNSPATKDAWKRNLLVATASSRMSRVLMEGRGTQETFVAGMLHDIGRNVLRSKKPELFAQFFKEGVSDTDAYAKCQEVLGFHPGDIGAAVAELWKLPNELSVVARYHHDEEALHQGTLKGEAALLLWIVQGGKLVADSALHRTVKGEGPLRLRRLIDVPAFRGAMAARYARAWYDTYAHVTSTLQTRGS